MTYESWIDISAPASEVFAFVSSPENMPRYLPSVSRAEAKDGDKIEVEGETDRGPYRGTGWFHVDSNHLMMRWGSEGSSKYAGHMTVTPLTPEKCRAEIGLLFDPMPKSGDPRNEWIQNGIDLAVDAIKEICEATSPSSAATTREKKGYVL